MSPWKISASTLFIRSCLVFIMLLIVVLPDVDLPDTAFHRGTAPLVFHACATPPLQLWSRWLPYFSYYPVRTGC